MNHFKKSQRLTKKSDYDRIFAQSNKLSGTEFMVLYCKNALEHARLGLAFSKKQIPKAHDRNRLKRLSREVFRTTKLPSIDIVLLARKGVLALNKKDIAIRLKLICQKLIYLCKK